MMVDANTIIELLNEFNFTAVTDDFINSLSDNDFVGPFEEFPTELYDEIFVSFSHAIATLKKIASACRQYSRFHNKNDTFWTDLANTGITVSQISAAIFYLIEMGQKLDVEFENQLCSLEASDMYLSMLCLNGSKAYGFYKAQIFERAIDSLKFCCTLLSNGSKSSGKGRKTKNVTGSQRNRQNNDSDEEMEDAQVASQQPPRSTVDFEIVEVILSNIMKTVWLFLGKFSLQNDSQCISHLIRNFIDFLFIFDPSNADTTKCSISDEDDLYFLTLKRRDTIGIVFANLHRLLDSNQGDADNVMRLVFKKLVPVLTLCYQGLPATDAIPVSVNFAKEATLNFVIRVSEDTSKKPLTQSLIYALVQHLCVKSCSKSAYRHRTAQTCCKLFGEALNAENRKKFIDWLSKLSRHTKPTNRCFAVELSTVLLLQFNDDEAASTVVSILIGLIVKRCSDSLAGVRTKALNGICDLLTSTNAQMFTQLLNNFEGQQSNHDEPMEESSENTTPTSDNNDKKQSIGSSLVTVALTPNNRNISLAAKLQKTTLQRKSDVNNGPNRKTFITLLIQRCSDEKVFVRKAALQVLELVASEFRTESVPQGLLDVLKEACMDPTLTVRKQAIDTLTSLIDNNHVTANRDYEGLERVYLRCVMPAVLDREASVQERALDCLVKILIEPLLLNLENSQKSWRLLALIECDHELKRYMTRLLQKSITNKSIQSSKVVKSIENLLHNGENLEIILAGWMFLSELSRFSEFAPSFAYETLKLIDTADSQQQNMENQGRVVNYICQTLSHQCKQLPENHAIDLLCELKEKIEKFAFGIEYLAQMFQLVYNLSRAFSDDHLRSFDQFCCKVANDCKEYLIKIVNNQMIADRKNIMRRLAVCGETALLCPKSIDKQMFYLMQALIVTNPMAIQRARQSIISSSQPTEPILSQGNPFFGSSQSEKNIQNRSIIDQHVSAFAVTILGKLCLQDEDAAKRCVSLLALQLETDADDVAVNAKGGNALLRNNVVVVLADLCVRYTSTVDRHLETLAACLMDRSQLIRQQTLTLLTSLLKEDYLKWRGLLFFRFLTVLLDCHPSVRSYAEYCLVDVLLERHPLMFFNHFLDCLYIFNQAKHLRSSYTVGAVSAKTNEAQTAKDSLKLAGSALREKRTFLYTFMLQRFTDQQRFQTMARICQDILASIVDELISLDDACCRELLHDALFVLASADMRLVSLTSNAAKPAAAAYDDDLSDEPSPPTTTALAAGHAMAEAVHGALRRAVRQTLVDSIVPTAVSLKHLLERRRDPLLHQLLVYVRRLMNDHKNEIDEILAIDRQLAAEIAYDLKRLERLERNSVGGAENAQNATLR